MQGSSPTQSRHVTGPATNHDIINDWVIRALAAAVRTVQSMPNTLNKTLPTRCTAEHVCT